MTGYQMVWKAEKSSVGQAIICARGGEVLQQRGHGISRILLPPPWDTVALGVQKFLTCEGRYTILFHYHFRLLSHLQHKLLMNIPYFLYGMLRQMVAHVHKFKRLAKEYITFLSCSIALTFLGNLLSSFLSVLYSIHWNLRSTISS
jgi:hypothetical protein